MIQYGQYILDGIIAVIILWCAISAFLKGFLKTCFGFLPMLAGIGISYFLSPVCSKLLRTTPLFTKLNWRIADTIHLDTLFNEQVQATQANFIEQLPFPSFLKNALMENNNPVVYQILDVDRIQDYIVGYLANVCLNIICMLVIFVLAYISARMILGALNIVFELPVLHFINRLSGLAVGTVRGVCTVWIICAVLTFFQYIPKLQPFYDMVEKSMLMSLLYHNNLLLTLVLKIFT